ncbi:MAG TPA: hypothetical protein VGX23_29565 [Actinocrinis sp.]|nr:hypothetical protein [Actinocrinis sp.]
MEISSASLNRLTPAEIGLLLIPGSPWELDSNELRAVDAYAEARGLAAGDPAARRAYLEVCVTVADELRDRPGEAEDGFRSSITSRIRLARSCGAPVDSVAVFALGLLRGLFPSTEAFARSRPGSDPDPEAGTGEPMYIAHCNALAVCTAVCAVFFGVEDAAVAEDLAPWLAAAASLRPQDEWLSRWSERHRSGRAD